MLLQIRYFNEIFGGVHNKVCKIMAQCTVNLVAISQFFVYSHELTKCKNQRMYSEYIKPIFFSAFVALFYCNRNRDVRVKTV